MFSLAKLPVAFRRITTSGNYIAEIDGLRFLALLGVLSSHTYANYTRLIPEDAFKGRLTPDGLLDTAFSTSGRGVELFFVLSGMI